MGVATVWNGCILVNSGLLCSCFLIMICCSSCGIFAALQKISTALEGCDITSNNTLTVMVVGYACSFFRPLLLVDVHQTEAEDDPDVLGSVLCGALAFDDYGPAAFRGSVTP